MSILQRRKFIQSSVALSVLPFAGVAKNLANFGETHSSNNRFKISLNAYSFNAPLTSGKTTLPDVMEFCSTHGFDAIDLTGYYFPGYPEVPSDEYIFNLKRKAHTLGLAISGTGIRNDFSQTDNARRAVEVARVKKWIEVAAKLGAPVIRIFTGTTVPQNFTWTAVADWISNDIAACVEVGKQHGVIVAIQNHNDFIKTAEQAIDIIKRVNSEWFGLVLDTGSFITNEPYDEIKRAAPYAVNWQIKEKLTNNGTSVNMDLVKLFRIIESSTYRGFLPIETLSAGDPFDIVPPFLKQVKQALKKAL